MHPESAVRAGGEVKKSLSSMSTLFVGPANAKRAPYHSVTLELKTRLCAQQAPSGRPRIHVRQVCLDVVEKNLRLCNSKQRYASTSSACLKVG